MRSRRPTALYVRESTGARVIEQGRIRLLCVGLFFVLCFGTIAARLGIMMISPRAAAIDFSLKIGPDKEGDADAVDGEVKSAAGLTRGDIVDKNGMLLATSLMMESAFANPREMSNAAQAAEKLSKTLRIDKDALLRRFKSKKTFVWIKRHLTPAEQKAVNALGIPGVYFLPEERRVYPYGAALSHVVGYVGVDNRGLAGVEKTQDVRLLDEARRGEPVKLSIDVRVQHILRDEMQKAVAEFKAIGATGMVLDAHSGEVVAMSSLPDFDPHHPAKATDAQKFNRAALGTYEMGSTFKSFTMAMALDSGTVKWNGGYDATNPLKIANFTITDAHGKKRWLSVPEIYAYSSNIATAKMALDCGGKMQREFLTRLGLTKPLQIELPERSLPLYPAEWKEIHTVTISYGHGISVTPLHLVRGIAALINGGTLPALTLLHQPERERDNKRVIAEKTSQAMRRLMRLVVRHGTGGKADIPGYRVGGKTGTAEKNMAGRYNENSKLSSFIAAFPMDDPQYVVLMMIDEPVGNKSTYGYSTGGWVAAPGVGRVIARMAPLLGLPPLYDALDDDAEKYWVDTDKKKPVQAVRAAPTVSPALDRRYLRAASY